MRFHTVDLDQDIPSWGALAPSEGEAFSSVSSVGRRDAGPLWLQEARGHREFWGPSHPQGWGWIGTQGLP